MSQDFDASHLSTRQLHDLNWENMYKVRIGIKTIALLGPCGLPGEKDLIRMVFCAVAGRLSEMEQERGE